jgi:hypothetical protein
MEAVMRTLRAERWLHRIVVGELVLYMPGEGGRARVIRKTIFEARRQKWSIIVYKRPAGAIEYGADWDGSIQYDGWFVFGYRNTGPARVDGKAIMDFVKESEFSSGTINSLGSFQRSLELKINARFDGTWRVHVMKGQERWSAAVFGVCVTLGDIKCMIMRVA